MIKQEIYAKCLALGMTPAGAAGCTANIMVEFTRLHKYFFAK